jgi:hypothetical protein
MVLCLIFPEYAPAVSLSIYTWLQHVPSISHTSAIDVPGMSQPLYSWDIYGTSMGYLWDIYGISLSLVGFFYTSVRKYTYTYSGGPQQQYY